MNCIDGREIRDKVGEMLKSKIKKTEIVPSLGILCVGSDPASLSFINAKKNFGEKYGFQVSVTNLSDDVNEDKIVKTLHNMETANDAVILQLPLPANFTASTEKILRNISSEKDVDNLSVSSHDSKHFLSPMILSLKKIINFDDENIKNYKFAVVGEGQVVGRPIKEFLENIGVNVVVISELNHYEIKDCDVVISGVGIPHIIKKENIKPGAVLIDYGCSYLELDGKNVLCGDFDKECYEICEKYTPVPGGMGPIVVACLFENVFEASRLSATLHGN